MTEKWRMLAEDPEAQRALQETDRDPRVATLRARMPEVYRELAPHRWLVTALERLPILAAREIPSKRGTAAAATSEELIIYVSMSAVDKLSLHDFVYTLAHEAMHALMADTLKRGAFDGRVIMWAYDVLNDTLLRDAGIMPTGEWKVYYVEDMLPGRRTDEVTAEELYEALAARWRARGREMVPGRTNAGGEIRYDVLGAVQVGDPDLYDEDPGVVARARRRWLRAVLRAPDLPPAVRRGIEAGWADLLGRGAGSNNSASMHAPRGRLKRLRRMRGRWTPTKRSRRPSSVYTWSIL
ncbi:MAG: hypothetical protein RXS42_08810 [Nitrososphaeria archaeon]